MKYFAVLALFATGLLLVVVGAGELQGSFGVKELVESAAWKIGAGVILIAFFGPIFYYLRARRKQPITQQQIEVETLAKLKDPTIFKKKS